MTLRSDRERIDLAGVWSYTPLAWTEFREDGELVHKVSGLPPAGTAPVPCNWYDTELGDFHGRVRFARDLPPLEGDGWWLCFEGVDYLAEVAIDGAVLIRHEGAFDGFAMPLTPEAHHLDVTVDAPREEPGSLWPYRKRQLKGIFTQWEPLEPFQLTTGGIWGDVWIERRPPVHVISVVATTFLVPRPAVVDGAYVETDDTDARVLVEVEVHSVEAATVSLDVSLCGAETRRELEIPVGGSRHRVSMVIPEPQLWWPWDRGQPTLHELVVRLGGDLVRQRIGLREVGYDEGTGTFSVNGQPFAVRGSNVIPDKWLARYDTDRAGSDVALVRDANLNAIRVCVHVATDDLYDVCDEAGILVWQDLPLQWDYLIDDRVITEAAEQAERIVRRLRPHPCIALWSCLNEPFPAVQAHFTGTVMRAVQAADGTRPVHPASDFAEHAYFGWFLGDIRDYALPSPTPIITEFGAIALPSTEEVQELGGTSWPPAGRDWDEILHEPTPMFDIAGVSLAESLDELVEASQRHQAAAVQRGIEAYRTAGRSFFHFLFMDGWPTVSWSVLSYGRVPKLAFAALAVACQPVLVGADLTRDTLSDAWDSRRFPPLAGGVWIVNDTREPIPDARWSARLAGEEIAAGNVDVAAESVTRWTPPGQRWPAWQPPALGAAGEYDLELDLTDAQGMMRSRNRYRLRYVTRDLDLQPPT
ncbi:MAG: hypothetical protein KY437_00620 [Actinobacteria bacterium]|nr:hypothetical protein [Actinomycetota bacterium]